MTNEMLEDFIKELKRKNRVLFIISAITIALLIGMTAFAFSEFHIVYESKTTYTAEQNADTQGNNSDIQQTIDTSEDGSKAYIIAGAVVVGLLILTAGGVFIYGKSTSKNHDKTESACTHHKDITIRQEEKEVTGNGKTDED